jgi:DUF4097 and DUF4098 domain-containing protein YvlB
MKRGLLASGIVVLAVAALGGCVDGAFGPTARESIDQSRPMSPTGELSLENTNGSVHVATWDEPRVRIEAVKKAATRQGLDELEVAIEGEGDRVAIRTRQPHRGFSWHRAAGVEYTLTVPRGARVSVRNVNGQIEIDGVAGRVRATTVNGTVEASHLGSEVEAATTNGSVEVTMDRVDASGRNQLRTTNGAVRLVLPRNVGALIEAHTVNGAVSCDFELAADARVSRRSIEGRVGSGGAHFELRTVNGTARIERGLAAAAMPSTRPEVEATPSSATR